MLQHHCDTSCRPIAPCNVSFLCYATQHSQQLPEVELWSTFCNDCQHFYSHCTALHRSLQLAAQSYVMCMRSLRFLSLKVPLAVASCRGRGTGRFLVSCRFPCFEGLILSQTIDQILIYMFVYSPMYTLSISNVLPLDKTLTSQMNIVRTHYVRYNVYPVARGIHTNVTNAMS